MSSSVLYNNVFQAKIGNVQNQADSSAVYSAGVWSFKNSTALTSVTIDNSGNVGVGTTTTSAKLTIKNPNVSGEQQILDIQNAASTGQIASLSFNQTDDMLKLSVKSGTGYLALGTGATGTERMRIDASGNLLVGTTTQLSTYKQSIAGSDNALGIKGATGSQSGEIGFFDTGNTRRWRIATNQTQFYVITDAGVGVRIDSGNTSWTAQSDIRSKKNIKPLELGLEQIKALKPTRFDYKTDESEESARVGFIAQEVLPVLPHAVSVPEDSEQMMGVSATEMIPVLVKAIQELSAKNEALEARLAASDARLAALEAK